MRKKNKVLLGLSIASVALAGAGVIAAATISPKAALASTSATEQIDLSKGTVGTNVITYVGTSATMTINKGTATNFYTSIVNAPRIYQKNYLRFEAKTNYVITAISATYATTGTVYKGNGWAGQTSATANGALATVTTALTPTDNTTNGILTWSFSDTDIVSVTLINGVATGATNVQLRPTTVSVSYTYSGTSVAASSVTLSGASSLAVGSSTNLTAAVYGSDGTTLATNQNVTWSITSGSENAGITQGGTLTGLNPGSVTVKATSAEATTIFGSLTVTITGSAPTSADKTLIFSDFTNAYTDGYQTVDGIVYSGVQVIGNTSYKEVVLGRNSGSLSNATALPSAIKKITLTCYSTPTVTVKAGASSDSVSTTIEATVSGSVYTYDFSGGTYTYFSISNGLTTTTAGFYSIVLEMLSSATINAALNDARAYATTFLEQTASECSALAVTSTNWTDIASLWDSSYKTYFEIETKGVVVTDIQRARERYLYIVKKYSYNNFMALTTSPSSTVAFEKDSKDNVVIYLLAGLALVSAGAFLVFHKKKQA